MAAINTDREQIGLAINRQENLFIANINSPKQTVISGGRKEVKALVSDMLRQGVSATILPLRQAFHSPMMAGVSDIFRAKLGNVDFLSADRQIISTVTGAVLSTDTNPVEHLCDQIISPVDFLSAVNLGAKEVDLFIEVGPGDLLTNLLHSFCDTPVISIDVGGESLSPFLHAAAATYVLGCATQVNNLFNDRFSRQIQWDWNPTFFQNPCEQNQSEAESELEVELEPEFEPKPSEGVQQNVQDTQGSTLERLRQIIADHTGLIVWSLEDSNRMLSDLHLNSITVGEIVTSLAAASGMAPPVDPTHYANASISEIAASLDQLKEAGIGNQADYQTIVAGIDTWVRYFEVVQEHAPQPELRRDLEKGKWEGFGMIPSSERLLAQLNNYPHGNGVLVCLNDASGVVEFHPLLQAAQRCSERAKQVNEPLYFVIIQYGWGGGGFARSFYLENEGINTLVINLATPEVGDSNNLIVNEIDAAISGFSEVFITAAGNREQPHWKLVKPPEPDKYSLIDDSDVVLVTGGGKGICAECGYQLARRTGCSLLILGRSNPQDSAELANNLERIRHAGLQVSYKQADVTDAVEVDDAIAAGVSELGASVTAVVHGAGLNQPRTVTNLTTDNIQATVLPKIDGLDNIIAAIDPEQLKLLANFSSIIARIGLQGEADYALANEWLSYNTEKFHALHPHCRCLALEWSVWSGVGMGQRLGRLDALDSQGISAISVDEGVSEFLRLIDTPDLPVSLIVTGRFGNPPTIKFDQQTHKSFRFIDSILVYYPGTELIAECHLSPKSDPYLDDHMLNEERLFPAVMALEAMTEAVSTLMGLDAEEPPPLFRDISFRKAIVIPDEGLTLRLTLLANIEGDVTVAIRCFTTNFQINHVEARCTFQNDFNEDALENHSERMTKMLPFEPNRTLYQNVLFQNGRFKRIEGYQMIQARRCYGQLSSDSTTQWFHENLPQTSLLGDPGARDAALHAIQVCIPHKIVIPIAVEEIAFGVLDPSQSYQMSASEIMEGSSLSIGGESHCEWSVNP
jgi:enediyne polyketide synthase